MKGRVFAGLAGGCCLTGGDVWRGSGVGDGLEGLNVGQGRFDTLESRLSFLERSVNRLDLFLVLGAALVSVILGIVHIELTGRRESDEAFPAFFELILDIIPEMLGALMVFVVSYLLLRLVLNARAERDALSIARTISDELTARFPDIEGVSTFRIGPGSLDELAPYHKLLPGSQSDISLLATQHGYLVKQQLKLVAEMARLGRKIKILMMSPVDREGNANPFIHSYESRWRNLVRLQSELESNQERLRAWHSSLTRRTARNIEIKRHFEFPVCNLLLIDRALDSGVAIVEPYIFADIELSELPVYVVYNKEWRDFFELHGKTFDWLWNNAAYISGNASVT